MQAIHSAKKLHNKPALSEIIEVSHFSINIIMNLTRFNHRFTHLNDSLLH